MRLTHTRRFTRQAKILQKGIYRYTLYVYTNCLCVFLPKKIVKPKLQQQTVNSGKCCFSQSRDPHEDTFKKRPAAQFSSIYI